MTSSYMMKRLALSLIVFWFVAATVTLSADNPARSLVSRTAIRSPADANLQGTSPAQRIDALSRAAFGQVAKRSLSNLVFGQNVGYRNKVDRYGRIVGTGGSERRMRTRTDTRWVRVVLPRL
jgi:hypothetical protein